MAHPMRVEPSLQMRRQLHWQRTNFRPSGAPRTAVASPQLEHFTRCIHRCATAIGCWHTRHVTDRVAFFGGSMQNSDLQDLNQSPKDAFRNRDGSPTLSLASCRLNEPELDAGWEIHTASIAFLSLIYMCSRLRLTNTTFGICNILHCDLQ